MKAPKPPEWTVAENNGNCAHVRMLYHIPRPKPVCRTQRPRTPVWSGFRVDGF